MKIALTRQPLRPYGRYFDPSGPRPYACHMERTAMPTATRPLGRGERAPDFVLACQDGTPTRFYAHAGGRPAVLLFYDAAGWTTCCASLRPSPTAPTAPSRSSRCSVA